MGRSASRSRDGAASGGGGSGKDGNSKRISEKNTLWLVNLPPPNLAPQK